MNYYYELDTRTNKFFEDKWQYWVMPNCSPAEGGWMDFKIHDDYVANSTRVWLENANGVYLVKPTWAIYRGYVEPSEFMMVKLKARNLIRAYDNAW